MKDLMRFLAVSVAVGVALGLGASGCSSRSSGGGVADANAGGGATGARQRGENGDDDPDDDDGVEIPLDEANVFFELNHTDGDLGIHSLIDGEAWKTLSIEAPNGRELLEIEVKGKLQRQGLTELFFESAEPGFEELPLAEFLERFPAGEYKFIGQTIDGETLLSKATLTHAIPDGPVLVAPLENAVVDPNNTVLRWNPVADPVGSRITRYEVLVTQEEPKPKRVLSAVLPATATSMTVPATFLLPGVEYKWEVLAIEEGGNQTLSEGVFRTAP
jgi:hypothetical protein